MDLEHYIGHRLPKCPEVSKTMLETIANCLSRFI